jgi:SAM-dependent methyltransferase
MDLQASIDLKLEPAEAFDAIADELLLALAGLGMKVETRAAGLITADGREVGRVVRWQPPEAVELEWVRPSWQPADATPIRLEFERIEGGTRVTLTQAGAELIGGQGQELAGWFASEVAAPLLRGLTPERLGEWITDRRARRPSGAQARAFYRDPLYHLPNFKAILQALRLTPADYLLEVGCGGGALLKQALESGCRAAAIDHSFDMVRVAREANCDAIQEERLDLRQAGAEALPFTDGVFTCAVMTGVFGFISDPVKALREVWRVLRSGGRFVLFTSSKELRGTPAAPEPIASRLHFYEDAELEALLQRAGFGDVRIERPDFSGYAREAGIPEEYLEMFKGAYGQLLVAQKRA